MIIDAVKEYIQKECPYVSGKKIKVNNLGEKPVSMSIEQVPGSPVIKKYVDGGSQRQMILCLHPARNIQRPTGSKLRLRSFTKNCRIGLRNKMRKKRFPILGTG